jgi:hypothetical protein
MAQHNKRPLTNPKLRMINAKSGIRCPSAKKKHTPIRNVTTFLRRSSGLIKGNRFLALDKRKKPREAAMQKTITYRTTLANGSCTQLIWHKIIVHHHHLCTVSPTVFLKVRTVYIAANFQDDRLQV